MLKATDVFPARLLPQLERPRLDAYLDKARGFLRGQFARRLRDVTDADLDAVVMMARDRNLAQGLTSDRDQLTALIPVIFWGSYFETDPQYRWPLIEAGLLTPDGQLAQDVPPMMLAEAVDDYRNAVRADVEDMQRPLRAFQALFGHDDPAQDAAACLDLMRRAFPQRTARMTAEQTQAFIAAASDEALRLSLGGADLLAHVALSLYFGVGFARDPLHRWVDAPYHGRFASAEEKRLALGAGIIGFVERFKPDPDDPDPMREGV